MPSADPNKALMTALAPGLPRANCGDPAESIHFRHSTMMLCCCGSSPKNRQSRALQLKPGKAASHRAERLDILSVYGSTVYNGR